MAVRKYFVTPKVYQHILQFKVRMPKSEDTNKELCNKLIWQKNCLLCLIHQRMFFFYLQQIVLKSPCHELSDPRNSLTLFFLHNSQFTMEHLLMGDIMIWIYLFVYRSIIRNEKILFANSVSKILALSSHSVVVHIKAWHPNLSPLYKHFSIDFCFEFFNNFSTNFSTVFCTDFYIFFHRFFHWTFHRFFS